MAQLLEFELNGRKLRETRTSTIRHDLWLMGHMRAAGVTEVTINDGETPEAFAERLFVELTNSDRMLLIIAGCFVEEGMSDDKWTPEFAEQLAVEFGNIADAETKQKLYSMMVKLTMGFFESGLVRLRRSQNSLNPSKTTSGDVDEPKQSLEDVVAQ
jgi:hypothetical protein